MIEDQQPENNGQHHNSQPNQPQMEDSVKEQINVIIDSAIYDVHGKTKVFDKRSLYIFGPKNKFRAAVVWLIEWRFFEYFIILTIIGNSTVLAIYDYQDNNSVLEYNQILDEVQIAFTAFFTMECILKIVAMGFVIKKNSYLRDGWNIIDFVVVLFGFIDFLPINANVKALRTLRVLRPLRSINAIKRMKNLVNTLIKALPSFGNVSIFLLFIFILFGIMGLQIYTDTFYNRCRTTPAPYFVNDIPIWPIDPQYQDRLCSDDGSGVFTCPMGTYCGNPQSHNISVDIDNIFDDATVKYGITTFDNIGKALLTEFEILTNDDWAQILFNVMDAEVPWLAAIYFCFLVVFGSFFLVNIILAVILDSFTKVQQEDIKNQLKYNEEKMAQIYLQMERDKQEQKQIIQEQQQEDMSLSKDPFNDESMLPDDETGQMRQKEIVIEDEEEEKQNNLGDSFHNLLSKREDESSRQFLQEQNISQFEISTGLNPLNIKFREVMSRSKTHSNDQQSKDLNESQDPEMQKQQLITQKTSQTKGLNFYRKLTHKFNEMIDVDSQIPDPETSHQQQNTQVNQQRQQNLDNLQQALSDAKIDNNLQQFVALRRAIKKVEHNNLNSQSQIVVKNQHKFLKICSIIANNKYFSYFISFNIILNTLILALDKYPQREEEDFILEKLNIAFFAIFFMEMVIKLLGYGLKSYFKDYFNTFDCTIVIISCIDVILQNALSQGSSNMAISALRAFRLLRVFKLAKSWQKFQELLKTIGNTLKDISTFSILLFLFIFTYTLLGLELFAYKCAKTPDDKIDMINGTPPISNFNTLFNAFISVFIILTGDGWSQIMFDYYRSVGAGLSLFYFISFLILGQYILLNLFLAILLQNFEEDSIDQELMKKQMKEGMIKKYKMKQKFRHIMKTLRYFFFCRRYRRNAKELYTPTKETPKISPEKILVDQEKSKKKVQLFLNKLLNKKSSTVTSATQITIKENFKLMQGKSLYLLTITNPIRRFIYKQVNNNKFDYFILLFIVLSCVQLALDNPLNDPHGQLVQVIYYVDMITTSVFLTEIILKVIAFGLVINGEHSYLRTPSNILDFGIVILSLVSMASDSNNLNVFKIFRLLRVLRPLRVISRNDGLRIAVQALWMAIPKVINVLIISILFFIIFGIIGVNYFKGQFFYCYDHHLDDQLFSQMKTSVTNKWDCHTIGGIWETKYYHFDNIINAMMTLFQIATLAGWSDVMYTAMSINGIDQQPLPMNSPYLSIYFLGFVIIGAFFTLNLFVGIVISTFNREKENIGKDFLLTQNQRQWLDAKLLIFRQKPKVIVLEQKNCFRNLMLKIQRNPNFDKFILACIVINTIALMVKWNSQPAIVTNITEVLNYLFAGIFSIEAIIKLIALGKVYFKDNWNIFDFVVVFGTLLGIVIQQSTSVSFGPQTTIIRSFRIFRIFRLIKRAKSLKIMFNTFIYTLPYMGNIGGLLGLLIFLYAILGVNLFAQVKVIDPMNDVQNFQSFGSSILILIKLATGDGWPEMLQAMIKQQDLRFQCIESPTYQDYLANDNHTVGCGQYEATILYFYSYLLIVKLVFLNLFIAIILQGFDDTNDQQNRVFNNDLAELYRDKWALFDPEGKGYIKIYDLPNFLFALGRPMGWDDTHTQDSDKREAFISELNLPIYNDFQDYSYVDILSSLSLKVLIEDNVSQQMEKLKTAFHKKIDDSIQAAKLKAQLQKDIEALNENEENIQAVKSLHEKERKIKSSMIKNNALVFTSKQERAARLLIRHLRRYVHKKRIEKGLAIQDYSDDQLAAIDNQLCQQLQQMALQDEAEQTFNQSPEQQRHDSLKLSLSEEHKTEENQFNQHQIQLASDVLRQMSLRKERIDFTQSNLGISKILMRTQIDVQECSLDNIIEEDAAKSSGVPNYETSSDKSEMSKTHVEISIKKLNQEIKIQRQEQQLEDMIDEEIKVQEI